MLGDARKNVGEPGLWIHVVHFGRDDEAVHHRGTVAAAIGATEQPGLPAQSDAAHGSFGGVIRQADAAVVEEAGERVPTLEHVVHRLGDIVAARELGALLTHPGFQIGDQRRAQLLADGPAPFGALAIDASLDFKQGVDPADCFQRQGASEKRPRTRIGLTARHHQTGRTVRS